MGIGSVLQLSDYVWVQPFDLVKHRNGAKELLDCLEQRVTCKTPFFIGTIVESENVQQASLGSEWLRGENSLLGTHFNVKSEVGIQQGTINRIAVKMFIERVSPRSQLMIIGAGPDALSLTQGAKSLGWNVTVVDQRPDYTKRFVNIAEVINIARADYVKLQILMEPLS